MDSEHLKKYGKTVTAYDIWKCLGPIWRGINAVKLVKVKDLDGNELNNY